MHGEHFIAIEWALVGLSAFLIALRFYLRYGRRGRLFISDYMVIIAGLLFATIASIDTALWKMGLFDGLIKADAPKWGASVGLATKAQTIKALKLVFTETTLYYCTMLATKTALLGFYYELIPRHLKNLRMALNILTGFTIVGWVISMSLKLFIEPVSHNWAIGTDHYCASYGLEMNLAGWIWHILTNICIFLLPITFVKTFKVPVRQTIFCAGFISFYGLVSTALAITAQISRTAPSALGAGKSSNLNFSISWLYFALDQSFAILVVCCPVFKAFVGHESWSSVKDKLLFRDSGLFSDLGSSNGRDSVAECGSIIRIHLRSETPMSGTLTEKSMVSLHEGWGGGR